MPIRKELRYFYPIDWPQLSAWVRFFRAKGCCEVCGRPHCKIVHHLGDGRWFDAAHETWRNGRGREIAWPGYGEYRNLKQTRVVLATAHLDHDPNNSRPGNLRAFCQRCHMLHDRPEHRRRRQIHMALSASPGRSIPGPLPALVTGPGMRGLAGGQILSPDRGSYFYTIGACSSLDVWVLLGVSSSPRPCQNELLQTGGWRAFQ